MEVDWNHRKISWDKCASSPTFLSASQLEEGEKERMYFEKASQVILIVLHPHTPNSQLWLRERRGTKPLKYPLKLKSIKQFIFKILIYLFGHAGFQLWHVGSSSLTRDRTQAPCIGSADVQSQPLDHRGSPLIYFKGKKMGFSFYFLIFFLSSQQCTGRANSNSESCLYT